MKIITSIGFAFGALGWLWLAIRYLGMGDTVGGIIFLVSAVICTVLFLRQITGEKKA
jgi:hypothetical protein